jgi:hypothetical protein
LNYAKKDIGEQGSVRVGWAAEQILRQKPQHNMLDKIAAVLLQDGQYVKEEANPNFSYDWNIRRNPSYKKEKWTERNPIGFEAIKGLITSIFSIIVSVILTLKIIDNKKDDNQNSKQTLTTQPPIKQNVTDTFVRDTSRLKKK